MPSPLMHSNAGEDAFRTEETGFAGRRNMVVGFEAPNMVYYRSDYANVSNRAFRRFDHFFRDHVKPLHQSPDKLHRLQPESCRGLIVRG